MQNASGFEKAIFGNNERKYLENNKRHEYMRMAIGEDAKDFLLDKLMELYPWNASKIDSLEYIEEKHKILGYLGVSEEEHQKYVDEILESKENNDSLGKTDILNKIAEIKGGRNSK